MVGIRPESKVLQELPRAVLKPDAMSLKVASKPVLPL